MQIVNSKTREKFPLSYKKIIKKTLINAVSIIVLLFIISMVLDYTLTLADIKTNGWMISAMFGFLGCLIVIILIYFYQRWYFAFYFYEFTPDYIQIRKNPIVPREITIPYERIQDVYVDQDILDRIFGLYDVHLSSATISSGMEAHIDGVEKQAADGLRTILLETIKQRISKNRTSNSPANNKPTN